MQTHNMGHSQRRHMQDRHRRIWRKALAQGAAMGPLARSAGARAKRTRPHKNNTEKQEHTRSTPRQKRGPI